MDNEKYPRNDETWRDYADRVNGKKDDESGEVFCWIMLLLLVAFVVTGLFLGYIEIPLYIR